MFVLERRREERDPPPPLLVVLVVVGTTGFEVDSVAVTPPAADGVRRVDGLFSLLPFVPSDDDALAELDVVAISDCFDLSTVVATTPAR